MAMGGCASIQTPSAPQTNVAYRTIDSSDTTHYEVSDDEVVTAPVVVENPPPVYPESAVALRLAHVGVRAKVIVGTDGTVDEIRVDPSTDADAYPPSFVESVREAVTEWRYAPLRFKRFAEVLDDQGNVTDTRLVSDEAKPFSLDYEFDFEFRDGKPVVVSQSAQAK